MLNGAESETLRSMLWAAADRLKRQRENSVAKSRSHKTAPSNREKRPAKSNDANNPSEYSADLSNDFSTFFDQVDSFPAMLPGHPVAGPSSVTLDQLAANNVFVGDDGDDGAYDEGADNVDDQALDTDTPAGDAE